MQILLFIVAILLFISLVIVHEWGHFIAARRNGVTVEEFGLGFPPRAWGKKRKSGMILSLNWLPLGGFVKMKGEHDNDTRKGSFGAASMGAKTKIMLAGVTMNLLVGLVLLTLLALVGMPKILTKDTAGEDQYTVASNTKLIKNDVYITYVEPDSPATAAGLKAHDKIRAINNYPVTNATDVKQLTNQFAGTGVNIKHEHDGKILMSNANLRSDKEIAAAKQKGQDVGHLGVIPTDLSVTRSTWSAPVVAVGFTWQLTKLTFIGLGHAIGGLGSTIAGLATGNHEARVNGQTQASSQVGGPVAIMEVLWGSGSLGINFMILVIAIISLTLALMNILPIPALDGGRLAMMLASRGVLKRPLSPATEERIVGASMAVILGLIALITLVDINRFF
jgi:regulator of sigma E protease